MTSLVDDLLFGQSYFLRFDSKLWEAMQPFPPLGSLYAASYLRSLGFGVSFFDAMLASSEEEWGQALDEHQPACAVIYEDNFNYLSKMCLLRMRQAALKMIDMAKDRGCIVIVSGADATDHPELYLRRGADFVLIGEGEFTLGELINHIFGKSDTPYEDILGVARLSRQVDASGENAVGVSQSPRRPDISELDQLPFPAWDLIDIEKYRKIWLERHGYYAMNMVTTRGCPFHCNWCAKPIWGQRYNVRSPENVVEELKWLKDHYQPDCIWLVDDIFGLKPGWLPKYAELVEKEGLSTPFKCLGRVDLLSREGEIEALKRAGASIVWVGAESGAQKILDAMEKGTRVEQIYQVAERLHAAGIQVGFFLQFGYPGETWEDIQATLQMVRDCRPDDIGMSVSYPLPGTKFYAAVKEQLGEQQNWYDSEDLAMLYRGSYNTPFYRQLHRVLHAEFRMRKAWNVLRSGNRKTGFQTRQDNIDRKTESRIQWIGRWLVNAIRLPLERWKLIRLTHQSNIGFAIQTHTLSHEQAAEPSQQP